MGAKSTLAPWELAIVLNCVFSYKTKHCMDNIFALVYAWAHTCLYKYACKCRILRELKLNWNSSASNVNKIKKETNMVLRVGNQAGPWQLRVCLRRGRVLCDHPVWPVSWAKQVLCSSEPQSWTWGTRGEAAGHTLQARWHAARSVVGWPGEDSVGPPGMGSHYRTFMPHPKNNCYKL